MTTKWKQFCKCLKQYLILKKRLYSTTFAIIAINDKTLENVIKEIFDLIVVGIVSISISFIMSQQMIKSIKCFLSFMCSEML